MTRILALLCIALLASCDTTPDPFSVGPDHIGALSQESKWEELETLLVNDSLIQLTTGDEYLGKGIPETEVYEKGTGKKLYTIKGETESDSVQRVSTVRIFDERYTTSTGLTVNSRWADIKDKINVSRIENTLSNAVVYVKDQNIYFTIDKNNLPSEISDNTTRKIETTMIPDTAPIKGLWLDWRE